MRPVPKDERLAELRRLGVSAALVQLAGHPRKFAAFPLLRAPYKVYRGMEWSERGAVFVPLWEDGETVTAVREKDGGVEFFSFSVEAPSSRQVLATSEQGLLATLFDPPLNECYDDPDDSKRLRAALATAARALRFRHLKALDAVYAANYDKDGEALPRAVKRFVRALDAASA